MTSLSSRAAALVLRLSGLRRQLGNEDRTQERVVAERRPYARPTRAMHRRLRIDWRTQDGFEVYTVAPRTRPGSGHVLYLHGGAYIHAMTGTHWRFIARMVEATGQAFTVPFYPLAPEHDCARTSRLVTALYRDLRQRHAEAPLTIMGDSAGGGLALSLAMQVRDAGLPSPAGLVLLSPWLDVTMTDPSQVAIERSDVMLMRPGLRQAGRWYAGTWSTLDPRVSPLEGELAGLPPILMSCGSHDILVADARRLERRARRRGIDLSYHEEPEMMHVYAILGFPESRAAQDRIARFVREKATVGA